MSNRSSPYQSIQTTHTTMSSLTTPGVGMVDMAGDGQDDDVVEVAETPLPALKSVFECPQIELCIVNDCKNGWKCLWCDQSVTPVHATRALAHLLKKKKCDIRVCKAIITLSLIHI